MRRIGIGAAAALALAGASAHADELRGRYVHIGIAEVAPNPNSVELSVAGASVPGATFDANSETGAAVEMGWYFNRNWALSATMTSAVLTENIGTGSLAAAPQLGSDSFQLVALTGHYHFSLTDWARPYVGGGLGYFRATGSEDGAVTNLAVEDAYGSVIQAGVNFDIAENWGAFIDVKQFLIGIEATGLMSGAPILATADIDPLVVNSGLAYRF